MGVLLATSTSLVLDDPREEVGVHADADDASPHGLNELSGPLSKTLRPPTPQGYLTIGARRARDARLRALLAPIGEQLASCFGLQTERQDDAFGTAAESPTAVPSNLDNQVYPPAYPSLLRTYDFLLPTYDLLFATCDLLPATCDSPLTIHHLP